MSTPIEDAVELEATVDLPGQLMEATSIDELRESIRDHDIPEIDSIVIKVGHSRFLRMDIDIRREWNAVRLRTRGTDEVGVNGLHSTVALELDRRNAL